MSETLFVANDLKLFNRLISIADQKLSLLEGLAYELIQLPLSLFDHKQQMRKPNKAVFAKHLIKGYVNVTQSPVATKLVIDGGWLLYQCLYVSGKIYVNIARKYLRLVEDFNKDITVVFEV